MPATAAEELPALLLQSLPGIDCRSVHAHGQSRHGVPILQNIPGRLHPGRAVVESVGIAADEIHTAQGDEFPGQDMARLTEIRLQAHSGDLELAAPPDEIVEEEGILLEILIAFRMGDDDLPALPLEFEDLPQNLFRTIIIKGKLHKKAGALP